MAAIKMEELERAIDIFEKNTVDLLPRDELLEKLKWSIESERPLIVKYGADPSKPDLHLGHLVCFNKLRDLQKLGHKIVFIVGDFTAMIGDPSERSETRPRLSEEEVRANAKTYFEQSSVSSTSNALKSCLIPAGSLT